MNKIEKARIAIRALSAKLRPFGMLASIDELSDGCRLWIFTAGDFNVLSVSYWYTKETVDAWAETQAELYASLLCREAKERGAA